MTARGNALEHFAAIFGALTLATACTDYDSYHATRKTGDEAGANQNEGGGGTTQGDEGPDQGSGTRTDAGPDSSPANIIVPGGGTLVRFDTPADAELFDFILPEPNVGGPAAWAWEFGDNPNLVQVNDVTAGTAEIPLGPTAIYRPLPKLTDASVSVHVWSTDNDAFGILLRYIDATHFYRFAISTEAWNISRGDGTVLTRLVCAGVCPAPLPSSPFGISHVAPGHVIKFEAVGSQLSAYLDGALLGTVTDSSYSSGGVGLFTRALVGGHFDDFVVEGSP